MAIWKYRALKIPCFGNTVLRVFFMGQNFHGTTMHCITENIRWLGKKHDRSGYDSDQGNDSKLEDNVEQRLTKTKKWKVTTSEEKVSHVNETKSQLHQNHGSKYSNVHTSMG